MTGVVVFSLFVALFARLFYLQVVDSPKLAAAAEANQIRTVYTEAPRGRILDRNGVVLAGNQDVDVITVQRNAPSKDATLLPRLAALLQLDPTALAQSMNDPKASPYKPIPVDENVPPAIVAAFMERQSDFPGVAAETQVQRWYPNGTLAAHLLGYVGEVNDTELAAHKNQGYRLGDMIGKSGIESAYESDLRGKPGVEKIEVDASGRAVRVVSQTAPVPGHDLELTVDINMQKAAEVSLNQGLALAPTTGVSAPQARGGAVVAVDPRDGGVLAMASAPTFDPGSFSKGISQEEYTQLTNPNGPLPLTNRAVQGQYAPGSTFKLVTSVAGLRSGVISPQTTVNDTGSFYLGNHRYQNAQGESFGPINLPKALTVSSDVYFYTLGSQLWDARKRVGDPIQTAASDFGFGSRLGVSIGGEEPGRVSSPDDRKKMHQENPTAFPEGNWYAGDNVNLAIGQGDTLATPLQIADAYATFANGGTLYRPKVVSRILDTSGKTLSETPTQVIHTIDLPSSVRQPIEQGFMGVAQDPKGTAYDAFKGFDLKAFPVAGKTGTAQVTGKQDSALFAGYGPVGDPRVAVSVVLEQSGWGGTYAAPVGRQVFAVAAGQSTTQVQLGTGTD